MQDLSKNKALELLPLVVDGEAEPDDRLAFLDYIENDTDVKQKYESQLRIKKLLQKRCQKAKAPDLLKIKIQKFLEELEFEDLSSGSSPEIKEEMESGSSFKSEPSRFPTEIPSYSNRKKTFYRIAVAAVALIVLTLFTFELLRQLSPALDPNEIIEDFVYAQFNESDGQMAMAGFQPGSISEAQVMLFEEFNHDLLMPAIKGAELTQVMYTDFAPGYKTPVLEYFQEDSNEYIYVFAFKIDSLENNQKLIRDPDAVEKCKSSDDYHIKDVNGNHVVSWKWKDNWYVAVSNHNGNDLAAIIEPMDQSLYMEE
jgi:hypothetical protein